MRDRFVLINEILNFLQIKNLNKENKKSKYFKNKGYLAKADIIFEKLIKDKIEKNFPEDVIISEEDKIFKKNFVEKTHKWLLDPLCGTTNYVKSIPLYSHSITSFNSRFILSGISDPLRNEIFLTDGINSYLNKKKISVSNTKNLKDSIVAINCNQSLKSNNIIKLVNLFAPPITRRIKILESANLELAYLSTGRIDAYINLEDKVWDVFGGSQLVKNAGGFYKYFRGSLHKNLIDIRGIIATNKYLFNKIYKIINENF